MKLRIQCVVIVIVVLAITDSVMDVVLQVVEKISVLNVQAIESQIVTEIVVLAKKEKNEVY